MVCLAGVAWVDLGDGSPLAEPVPVTFSSSAPPPHRPIWPHPNLPKRIRAGRSPVGAARRRLIVSRSVPPQARRVSCTAC
jgi:hypothetical protein